MAKPKHRRRHFRAVVDTGARRHEVQMVVEGDRVQFHLKGQRRLRYWLPLEKVIGLAWRHAQVVACETVLGTGGKR